MTCLVMWADGGRGGGDFSPTLDLRCELEVNPYILLVTVGIKGVFFFFFCLFLYQSYVNTPFVNLGVINVGFELGLGE